MERNLLAREINTLTAPPWLTDLSGSTSNESEVKTFPNGKFYGFLKEKSFLRKDDLKTKKTFEGKDLFYPDRQMVDILGENKGWLLVEGSASYTKNGVTYVYSERNIVQKLSGWVKKSWVDVRESVPLTTPAAQTADEHVGKLVNYRAKVRAELGIKLHRTPNPSTKIKDGRIYQQNSNVTIIGLPNKSNDPDWYKIRTEDGKEGWIESRYVTQIPDADLDLTIKEYYIVKPGDMLEPLVKNRYSSYDIKTGDDFRTIVHAFSILNNSNPALYYRGVSDSWWRDHVFDRDMAGTRRIYASLKLRKGGLIYFPTETYINYLKETGKVGQRPDWKNHAIDFGKAILNFIEGFYESISKIIADIWDDIKNMFSLGFFKDIYDLIKEVIKNPGILIEIAKEMLHGIQETLKNLTSKIASVKYKAYGSVIGMISGNLVLGMLVPGSSALKGAKAARKLKVVQKIERQLGNVAKDSKKFDSLRKKLIKYAAQQKQWTDFWGKKAEKITDAVDNRHKLRKELGLKVGDKNQAHHIIPIDVLKNNKTVQKAVIDGGFDINGKINGISVPPSFHLAGHDNVHKMINDEINKWASENPRATGRKIREHLEQVVIKKWKVDWKDAKETWEGIR